MNEFSVGKYPQSSLLVVYAERNFIQLDPVYQRIGGIWTNEKRQLLVDSLINGFDVPKLYFHEFFPAQLRGDRAYRFAIIDGKQRLQTIWDFIDGNFSLAEDFKYLHDEKVEAGGLDYPTLARRYPTIKAKFDATLLDIVTVRTNDIELIEDMFSRLNEAVPLNAPEKRGALGGPLPSAIRETTDHTFLKKRLPFPDNRYRHRDLTAKFLYIEFENGIVNTKKSNLDKFVKDFKRWRDEEENQANEVEVGKLVKSVCDTLDLMAEVFVNNDSLLRQVGMVTVYYHLCRNVHNRHVKMITRRMLAQFEKDRQRNRKQAELEGEGAEAVNTDLLEFDKHSQTPNDAYAIRIRLRILLRYLKDRFAVDYEQSIVTLV